MSLAGDFNAFGQNISVALEDCACLRLSVAQNERDPVMHHEDSDIGESDPEDDDMESTDAQMGDVTQEDQEHVETYEDRHAAHINGKRHQLWAHQQMYVYGDRFEVEGLKSMAGSKFMDALNDKVYPKSWFAELVREVLKNTMPGDTLLRDPVLAFWTKQLETSDSALQLEEVIKNEVPEVWALGRRLIKNRQELQERLRAAEAEATGARNEADWLRQNHAAMTVQQQQYQHSKLSRELNELKSQSDLFARRRKCSQCKRLRLRVTADSKGKFVIRCSYCMWTFRSR